jgi:outer membrane protein assembly factor BamD (BamD/ComL family)
MPPPDAPTYPGYPGYAGASSTPLGVPVPGAPGMFAPASTPTYPGFPGSPSYPVYPGYAGGPSVPFAPPFSVPLAPAPQNALARPFPAWLTATFGVGSSAVVSLVYILAELVGHADWADGARIAGFVALGLAGAALIVTILRAALGRRAGAMLALAAMLVVGLSAAGVGGVVASPQLHNAQAHSLEGSQAWAAAIHEYTLAGEQPPNAPDIARTLDEQGEQQLAQGDYKDALAIFQSVGAQYAQSGDPLGRANDDVFKTYSAWVKSNGSDVPYSDAISFFEHYRTTASCSTSCASDAAAIEAQALYQYGTSLAASSDYTDAITQFEKIASSFASSSYAAQAHSAAATAYLAVGKQQLTTGCSNIYPFDAAFTTSDPGYQALLGTYQKLVSKYADTPEGQQAKKALAAPQSVSGTVINAPAGSAIVLLLSKHANPNAGYFSGEYKTTPGGRGSFAFRAVAPGVYNLSGTVTTPSVIATLWYTDQQNNPISFHVYALCPVINFQFDAKIS